MHERSTSDQHSVSVDGSLDDPLARAAGLRPRVGIFNLGEEGDYRVPDGGLLRPGADAVYLATAAMVIEIVSPDDQTWEKLGFYAAHHVDELLIVDPQERRVHWRLHPTASTAR